MHFFASVHSYFLIKTNMSFKTNTLSKFNINLTGNGSQPILFVHGYGCDQNMWRKLLPYFKDNYKIVLMDLMGAGNSDIEHYNFDKYDSLQGYADDIVEICQSLELSNVILVGHSVSAMIGLLATNSAPEIFSSLIMVTPSPCYINKENYQGGFSTEDIDNLINAVESNYLGWSSEIAPAIMGTPDQPELAEELKESFCRNNPTIAKHFAKVTFTSDNRANLLKSQTNTLVIQVTNDFLAAQKVGEYIHHQLPKSKLEILQTHGHCPHMSNPKITTDAIANFLILNE